MMNQTGDIQRASSVASFRSRLRQRILEKSVRDGRQISQSEVARSAKISLPTVQRWYDPEYTFNRVDADTLYSLMDYFGCTFEELIERVPDDKDK